MVVARNCDIFALPQRCFSRGMCGNRARTKVARGCKEREKEMQKKSKRRLTRWLWVGRVRVNKRPSGVMAVSATSDAFRWLFSPWACLRVASTSLFLLFLFAQPRAPFCAEPRHLALSVCTRPRALTEDREHRATFSAHEAPLSPIRRAPYLAFLCS